MSAETLSAAEISSSGDGTAAEGNRPTGYSDHTSYVLGSYPGRTTGHMITGAPQEPSLTGHVRAERDIPIKAAKALDRRCVADAVEFVESIRDADAYERQLHLTGLCGCVMDLWDTAVNSSESHQEILAALERAVRAAAIAGEVTREQLDAFREALTYLPQQHPGRTAARIVRNRLREAGSGSLSFTD